MHDTVKDVLQNLTQLTDDELRKINAAVIDQLKFNRNADAVAKRHTLTAGDRVQFIGRRGKMIGTIKRVKRKKAIVSVDASDSRFPGNWDVPLGMLSAI